MDQQELGLKVPTGEASKRHDPANTTEGTYFAQSYRGKRVCIDSGLLHILNQFIGEMTDRTTFARIDYKLAEFLADYPIVWWKHPRTGEYLKLHRLTSSNILLKPAGMDFAPRQFMQNTLVLSPHYEVPNDQSMGRAPVHER